MRLRPVTIHELAISWRILTLRFTPSQFEFTKSLVLVDQAGCNSSNEYGILFYLSFLASVGNSGEGTTFQSPAFLFGSAQTISAISLGAVSVSHLEVATPSKAGAVYALGNVFAAISGSITVTLFGILLDNDGQQAATADFSLPFQIVAILSIVGSVFYSLSIESDVEIGMQESKKRLQYKSR